MYLHVAEPPTEDDEGGLSGGAIAGIVIGSLVAVGLLVGILKHLDRQKKVIHHD